MADKADNNAGPEEASPAAPVATGGFKAWLPLILTVLLMPAMAYGMTVFVLLPKLQKGLGVATPEAEAGAESGHSEGGAKGGPRQSVTMNKLLVNVAGTMGARYLLVSASVSGTGPDFKEKMEAGDAQLRDMAQGVLATKTLADLEKPGARNLIRTELISGFNNILGEPLVQEIYLVEFAIQ